MIKHLVFYILKLVTALTGHRAAHYRKSHAARLVENVNVTYYFTLLQNELSWY